MLIWEKHKLLRPREQIQAMLNKLSPYHSVNFRITENSSLESVYFLNTLVWHHERQDNHFCGLLMTLGCWLTYMFGKESRSSKL